MGNKGGQGGRVWGSVSKSSFRSSVIFHSVHFCLFFYFFFIYILLGSFFSIISLNTMYWYLSFNTVIWQTL